MSTATPNAANQSGGAMRWLVGAAVVLIIVAIGVFAGTQPQVAAVRKDDVKYHDRKRQETRRHNDRFGASV